MNIIFQTGQTANGRQNQTTSKSPSTGAGIIFNERGGFTFSSGKNNHKEAGKEELTKDEEEKFYKKVFKTSLI